MTSHLHANKAVPPRSDKSAQPNALVDPQDAILRCLVLTEAAEFTLELIDIVRVLTPLAARALELSCPCVDPSLARLALERAQRILDENDEEADL